jgi:hypothetical protein
MRDPFKNPFATDDPQRREIWQMLLERDSEAFVTKDWARVEKDFIADQFEGINAYGSLNPDEWKIAYPHLKDYRDEWLKMADEFMKLPLECCTHRELIFKLSKLEQVEISGDIALCHKKFFADEPLKTGKRYQYSAQTLYRLRRANSRWKIVGFIGYLPFQMQA